MNHRIARKIAWAIILVTLTFWLCLPAYQSFKPGVYTCHDTRVFRLALLPKRFQFFTC